MEANNKCYISCVCVMLICNFSKEIVADGIYKKCSQISVATLISHTLEPLIVSLFLFESSRLLSLAVYHRCTTGN